MEWSTLHNEIANAFVDPKTGLLLRQARKEKWLKQNHPEIFGAVLQHTAHFVNHKYTLNDKLLFLLLNIKEEPCCLNCGKPVIFISWKKSFQQYCSRTCRNKHIKHCGADNNFVKHKDKITKVIKEKYGVDNISQHDSIKKKKIQTLRKNYNDENATAPLQVKEIQEKQSQTNIKKYGGKAPACDQKIIDKMKQTCLDLYGAENYKQKDINPDILKKLNDKEFLEKEHIENKKSLRYEKEISEFFFLTISHIYKI